MATKNRNINPYARAAGMIALLSAARHAYSNNQISLEQFEAELGKIGEYRSRGKGSGTHRPKNRHSHMANVRASRTRRNIRKRKQA